ncbi:uncharacterized protein LOC120082453 [Benincasa hispida]|uniref:uncharacterized protein LOC120082453 n=1 Tax=Benincasa hispida TaxID=102211 RepID=UPI0019003F67|nr:uncharacterized protein LOC120082453 [Benincasa hispida]
MAQKQIENRLEKNEREVSEMKEMMLGLCKNIEKLTEEMRESNTAQKVEESGASDGRRMKMKRTADETESTPSNGGGGSDKSKYKRLEIPIFAGENPESWVYRAEHYFEIYELSDQEKVKVVVINFGPEEVDWFRWSHNRRPINMWEELKIRMFEYYRPTGEGSLSARLLRIKQEGSYADYVKKFVTYSAPLPDLAEEVLKDAFVNGLEPTLRVEVISRKMITLEECIYEAQLALADLGVVGPSKKEAQGKKNLMLKSEKTLDTQGTKRITLLVKSNFVKKEPPMKRLSDSEFRERLDKGLCFRCNEKYSPEHRCKSNENRELMLLITNENEETTIEKEEREELREEEELETKKTTEIALRSIYGLSARGTMKLRGKMKGKEVVVLIDCGATHNFVHKRLVDELELPMNRKSFSVVMGNGEAIR